MKNLSKADMKTPDHPMQIRLMCNNRSTVTTYTVSWKKSPYDPENGIWMVEFASLLTVDMENAFKKKEAFSEEKAFVAYLLIFQMLNQLIDHAHQNITQQADGHQEHLAVGLAGGVVVNGIGHDGQDQSDDADDFDNGFHKVASRNFFFPLYRQRRRPVNGCSDTKRGSLICGFPTRMD